MMHIDGASPPDLSHTIADRVARTCATHSPAAPGLPLGVLASLALLRPDDLHDSDPAKAARALCALPDDQIGMALLRTWRTFARSRPDLLYQALPLAKAVWNPHGNDHCATLAALARAAVDAGLFHLTLAPGPVTVDLFGPLLDALSAKAQRDGQGQFRTPSDATALLSWLVLHDAPGPGHRASFTETAAGTGGIVLAHALRLREQGHDPADMHWEMVDADPWAAACLAVNAHLWGLGPHVLIGCADVLARDWRPLARSQRALGTGLARLRPAYDLLAAPTPESP
ncbi:SAM-dependent DNA methyltransferase [Nocardiopsis dassonvillei]|uniref:SAM-dependent DNA methyltransferase n=1 Tax=Nocardiopsis dassonvillei TaxID=2014 RepID=UPI00200FDBA5|nr:SAM-dependent DNA methyltransferase [Nocardiopsis dassonvillei]MCK9874101.1 SAM-dependent DNA methyltransferase [Nocardiopsis dassonvillei]